MSLLLLQTRACPWLYLLSRADNNMGAAPAPWKSLQSPVALAPAVPSHLSLPWHRCSVWCHLWQFSEQNMTCRFGTPKGVCPSREQRERSWRHQMAGASGEICGPSGTEWSRWGGGETWCQLRRLCLGVQTLPLGLGHLPRVYSWVKA